MAQNGILRGIQKILLRIIIYNNININKTTIFCILINKIYKILKNKKFNNRTQEEKNVKLKITQKNLKYSYQMYLLYVVTLNKG